MPSCSPLHPGKVGQDWARKWGAGVGRGPGDLVAEEIQGLRALPLAAPPEPENRKLEGCLGGITAQRENALNTGLYSYRLPLNCSGIPSSKLKRHTSTPYPVPSPKQAAYEQLPLSNSALDHCCCSVVQSCPTLCNPMMAALPVSVPHHLRSLPKFMSIASVMSSIYLTL